MRGLVFGLIALTFVLLFVPVSTHAIDYVDSSGYVPSWAPGNGYHTVLVKCTQVSGDGSNDSYWCLEWMAYVLDQGIDNFPESTSETSHTTLTTTKIDPNDLVKGDLYFGSLTKYLPPNSSYEKAWDPNLDWKPNPNLPGWTIGDPFTFPQTDNEKNTGLTDNVVQGIFVPDISGKNSIQVGIMILEFENNFKANEFFEKEKVKIQNKINSQSIMEDTFGGGSVYFEDCQGYLKNFELADESSSSVCVIDKYIVLVGATQFGGYVTDKSYDYVLPEEIVYDISTKIGKNIDVTFQKIIDNQSGGISISDEKSCKELISGAKWNNNGCVAKSLSIESGEILTIYRGVTLINSNGVFKNSGTINVLGGINNWGTFDNFGTINVSGQISIDDNKITNKGTIMINDDASVVVQDSGTLDNYGTLTNNDQLINYGIINNHCDGVISGNPVGLRDFGMGTIPINQVSCETISEKVEPKITTAPTSEIKTSTEVITTNPESEGGGCLIATATYGSELAPEVQKLRELRDNSLLGTESGTNFINLFNDVYYSFSPIIADYERENPVFKEAVKLFITPMIASLSILNYVDMDSESEVLGYGISLIVLNVMMYLGIPILAIMKIRK
jgi:hypothetical protein